MTGIGKRKRKRDWDRRINKKREWDRVMNQKREWAIGMYR